jgi:hypothetical protein
MSVRYLIGRLFPTLAAIAVFPIASPAQPLPPVLPNPLAPNLAMPVPLGVQRGTKLDLVLTGTNLAGPTQFWTSFPAKVTIPTDHNNGKDNTKLRVRLDVLKDAPLGYHTIRLATTRGLSNLRLFCVDDLPQVLEVNTNHSMKTAQAVKFPCVVVGKADAELSDYFKVTVKAGERLSFEVLGRRLGSPFDPQLSLYDPRTGRELPDGHSNDAPGCQTDPRLTYTFKKAGDYLVEVRDVMYRGGPDFWYRLRIGDFPCATTPVPMAAKRGTKAKVNFAGPNVKVVADVEVQVPTDPAVNTLWVAPKGKNGLHGWPVALAVSDHDEVVEKEPNDVPAKATRVPVPGGVTGRFHKKGDVDHYTFAGKKGQRYIIEAHTHEFYSPTEVYMVLKDAKGNKLATTNPVVAPRLDFTPSADGDYVLVVEHLLYWGGPSETYRITVRPFQPDFSLTAAIDRYDVPQGGLATARIMAVRNGYAGPIEVSVVGPKGIGGKATINAGQPPNPNIPAAFLNITAGENVAMGVFPIVIQGKATINGKAVTRYASVRAVVSQNLANLPYPPRNLYNQIGVAVTEKPLFSLAAKFDKPATYRGGPLTVTVTVKRSKGFAEEITLTSTGMPPLVLLPLKTIPKNQNEVKVALKTYNNTPFGNFLLRVTGKARYQNRDYVISSPPAPLAIGLPFQLRVEPALFKVTQGGKAKRQGQGQGHGDPPRRLPGPDHGAAPQPAGQRDGAGGDHRRQPDGGGDRSVGRRHRGGGQQGGSERPGHGDGCRQPAGGVATLYGQCFEKITLTGGV